jgi:hypothetical protein
VVHCSGIQHTFYGKHRQAEYCSVVDPDPQESERFLAVTGF